MKAWVLHGINDIRYEDVQRPDPADDEVLLKVRAAGVCGSDIPRIYDTGAHRHPLIPGHEFSGEVAEVGKGVDGSWKGKRVGVFPLIPCRECAECRKQHYEMCRQYDYLGSRRDGGFAEYVCVPAWNLVPLLDCVGFEAAAMLEPMAVAVHAMRIGNPVKGEKVAVCGQGTIGLLLSMFLLDRGISDLFVVGNKEFQRQQAMKIGISSENYCDSKKTDPEKWLMDRTEGLGADLYIECVGRNETAELGLNVAAAGGRVLMMGNPHSDMSFARDSYWKILRKQLKILGTWNSAYLQDEDDDWHYVLKRLEKGSVSPEALITHRLSLSELEQGLTVMHERTEDYCKVMVTDL